MHSVLTRRFLSNAFLAEDSFKLFLKLRNVMSSKTRSHFTSACGVVLDGPVGASVGQASTSIFFALRGARVLCAKVGPRAVVQHEWAANEAVHAGGCWSAPAVVRAESCIVVPSATAGAGADADRAALLLPMFPMSVADAMAALPLGAGRARDALAASVALCGLAAVAAFVRARWAHGDIKPANIMLAGGSSAACVLIDLGTARAIGGPDAFFTESSVYSLNEPRDASTGYDLVCLGATLAELQHEIVITEGTTTRATLLADVREAAAEAVAATGTRPPASIVAEEALELAARADVSMDALRALADKVADVAMGLGAPAVDAVWPGA